MSIRIRIRLRTVSLVSPSTVASRNKSPHQFQFLLIKESYHIYLLHFTFYVFTPNLFS